MIIPLGGLGFPSSLPGPAPPREKRLRESLFQRQRLGKAVRAARFRPHPLRRDRQGRGGHLAAQPGADRDYP